MTIINLTQHVASPDQVAHGVIDLASDERGALQALLTFEALPSALEIQVRADAIAEMVRAEAGTTGHDAAMIGGALWLMMPLAQALRSVGIEPLFAFSAREAAEVAQPDGSVKKVSSFRHIGFVRG